MFVFAFAIRALTQGKYNSGLVNAGLALGILKDDVHPQAMGAELLPVQDFREGVLKNAIDGADREVADIDADINTLKEIISKGDTDAGKKAAFEVFDKVRFAAIASSLVSPVVDSIHRAYVYKHEGKVWKTLGKLIFTGRQRLPYDNFTITMPEENVVVMEIVLDGGFVETINFKKNDKADFIEDKRLMEKKEMFSLKLFGNMLERLEDEAVQQQIKKALEPNAVPDIIGSLGKDFKTIIENAAKVKQSVEATPAETTITN